MKKQKIIEQIVPLFALVVQYYISPNETYALIFSTILITVEIMRTIRLFQDKTNNEKPVLIRKVVFNGFIVLVSLYLLVLRLLLTTGEHGILQSLLWGL